jgi:hypothetical protein
MRSNTRGIALITGLIIMVVVLAFGVGSIHLSQSSLGLAGSQRAHLVAKNNAEVGMDAAFVALRAAYVAGALPAPGTFTVLPTVFGQSSITYQLLEYTPLPIAGPYDRARVRVRGTAGPTARFETEAIISIVPGELPEFRVGYVSENVVQANGNINAFTNADVHGNLGFSLDGNGTFKKCEETSPTACDTLSGTAIPVTASEGAIECKASKPEYAGFCLNSTTVNPDKLTDPVVVGTPPYEQLREMHFGTPGTTAAIPPCTLTTESLATSYTAGTVVCVTGTSELKISSDRTYSDITIVVYGNRNTLVEGNLTLTRSGILTLGTLHNKGNLRLNDSQFFSDKDMTIEGNLRSSGSSTVASGNDILVKGNIEHFNAGNEVGLLLASKRNFRVEGNLEKNGIGGAILNAAVWAGGTATVTGNVSLLGGISSVGRLYVAGNSNVDGRAVFDLDLAPQNASVHYASRR